MDQDQIPIKDPGERQEFLLSQYLDGQLDDVERADLEQQLRDDPALRARLDGLRRVDGWVREWGERAPATDPAAFVEQVRRRREATEPRRPVSLLFRLVVPMAAAAAILLVISLFRHGSPTTGGAGPAMGPVAVVTVGPGAALAPAANRPSPVIRVSFSRSPAVAPAASDSTTRSLLVAAAGSFSTDSAVGVVDEDLPVF